MKKSTAKGRVSKPAPPYPGFPLYAHASGRWAKRIRGKLHYFGQWGTKKRGRIVPVDDVSASAAAAIDRFHREWPFLSQGRTPPAAGSGQGCDVKALCNVFLTAQQRKCNSNEITARTFEEYRATTDRIVAQFGKDRLIDDLRTEDFESLRAEMAKQWGPVSLGNAVQRVRTVFKYGFESGLLPVPIRFGPHFKRPSKSVLRRHRAKSGKRTFEAAEIRDMLEAATIPMRAMIYLGINCGFGNGDCGGLTKSALDLAAGWVDFPRPKTGIERRCPLWPETMSAIHDALAARPCGRTIWRTRPLPHQGASCRPIQQTTESKLGRPAARRPSWRTANPAALADYRKQRCNDQQVNQRGPRALTLMPVHERSIS